MNEALVQNAEHDIDGDNRSEDEPGLAGQRLGEFGGVARIAAGHRGRHADPLLRGGDDVDRVAQGIARRQIEADGDRGELLLMRDRQRRRDVLEAREGGERHLVRAGHRVRRRTGVGIGGAGRGVGDSRRRAVGRACAGDIELAERGRVLLVARLRFENDAVLVRLAIDRRDLPLAESVVERVGDALHRHAEAAGLFAVDIDQNARPAFLRFGGDFA